MDKKGKKGKRKDDDHLTHQIKLMLVSVNVWGISGLALVGAEPPCRSRATDPDCLRTEKSDW